jgi:hypothetical protein
VNYVIAAWLACAFILALYAVRTVHRERTLRRSLAPKAAAVPGNGGSSRRQAQEGSGKWT